MKTKRVAVIPARMNSSRLPGKPLKTIGDKPLVKWVYDAVHGSGLFDEVAIATDSPHFADQVDLFGLRDRVFLTSRDHQTGTDRVAELVSGSAASEYEVIANVQCDMPFVSTRMLRELVEPFDRRRDGGPVTLAVPGLARSSVKVACRSRRNVNRDEVAMYFTRRPIAGPSVFSHIGLYAFRREHLASFATWRQTPQEKFESLEQMRFLEHGERDFRVVVLRNLDRNADLVAATEVNTPCDLERANRIARDFAF